MVTRRWRLLLKKKIQIKCFLSIDSLEKESSITGHDAHPSAKITLLARVESQLLRDLISPALEIKRKWQKGFEYREIEVGRDELGISKALVDGLFQNTEVFVCFPL